MSSNTTRVSLYKPAGGEDINVTTDLNNNLDKLDTNLNFRVVANAAARNAITPFWAGLNVRETDTGNAYISNGSGPISGSWDQIATANTYNSALNISTSATGNTPFNLRVGAEANNRYHIKGDGANWWGAGGATAVDTNLYRSAANTLKTDDNLIVLGTLNVTGASTFGSDQSVTGNQTITGDLAVGGIGQFQYATTGSNRTIAATAMTTITNLSFSVVANAVYVFQAQLFVTSAVAGTNDLRVGFSSPTSATVDFTGNGMQQAQQTLSIGSGEYGTQIAAATSAAFLTYGTTTTATGIVIFGRLVVAGTAGTIALQCGGASGTGNNTVNAASFMTLQRVA